MSDTPTPRTDEIEGNLIEFCDNPIRFPKMTEHSRQLEKELTAVTEQRDEAREQRDRLAEALEQIASTDPNWRDCLLIAREALQSLKEH